MKTHKTNASEFRAILNNILRIKSLNTPYQYNGVYRADLKSRLNDYLSRIKKLPNMGPISSAILDQVDQIEDLNRGVINALDAYLSGNSGEAYRAIKRIIGINLKMHISNLNEHLLYYNLTTKDSKSLYRVRLDLTSGANKEAIFHIPFEMRHIIKTQRYSIAGVPSLYLGTSLLGCWLETGKPDFNRMALSHVKLSADAIDTTVVNFGYTLNSLKEEYAPPYLGLGTSREIDLSKAVAYLAVWPLVMASSYTVKHPGASFQEEYVLPNLILQWISKAKGNIAGIKYCSTKNTLSSSVDLCTNYVFPTKTMDVPDKGFCSELVNKFHISTPISWQILDSYNLADNRFDDIAIQSSTPRVDNFEHHMMQNYQSTKFHTLEQKLRTHMKIGRVS